MPSASLLRCCQRRMFYDLHKIFSVVINDGHWYCFCRDLPGWRREDAPRDWRLICVLKFELKRP